MTSFVAKQNIMCIENCSNSLFFWKASTQDENLIGTDGSANHVSETAVTLVSKFMQYRMLSVRLNMDHIKWNGVFEYNVPVQSSISLYMSFNNLFVSKRQNFRIYPKYSDREPWANNADQDQTLHNSVTSISTLFATYPAVFQTQWKKVKWTY